MGGPGQRHGAPFVVRIGGLPFGAIRAFSSPGCTEALLALQRVEHSLGHTCAALVEAVHRRIPEASPAQRRLLLRIKRDSHNHRSMSGHQTLEESGDFQDEAIGQLLDAARQLEAQKEACWERLAETYSRQKEAEDVALERLAGDAAFRRGVALASPALANAMEKFRLSPPPWRRARCAS
jgi:hypothetical protein